MQAGFPVAPQALVAMQSRQMVQPLPAGTERILVALPQFGVALANALANDGSVDQATVLAPQSTPSGQGPLTAMSVVAENTTSTPVTMPGSPGSLLDTSIGSPPAAFSVSIATGEIGSLQQASAKPVVPVIPPSQSWPAAPLLTSWSSGTAPTGAADGVETTADGAQQLPEDGKQAKSRRTTGGARSQFDRGTRVAKGSGQPADANSALLPTPQFAVAMPQKSPHADQAAPSAAEAATPLVGSDEFSYVGAKARRETPSTASTQRLPPAVACTPTQATAIPTLNAAASMPIYYSAAATIGTLDIAERAVRSEPRSFGASRAITDGPPLNAPAQAAAVTRTSAAAVATATVGPPDIAGRATVRSEPRSFSASRAIIDALPPNAPALAVTMDTPTAAAAMTAARLDPTNAAPVAVATIDTQDIAGQATVRSEPRSAGADRAPTDVPTPGAPVQAAAINTSTAAMGLPTGYVAATDAAPVAMAMVGAPDIAGRTTMRSEPRSTGADRPQTDVPAPGAPVQAVTMNTLTAGAGVTTAHVAVTNAAPAAIATVGLADTAGWASVRSEPRSTGAEPAPTDLAHVAEALPEPLPGPVQAEQTTSPVQQRTAAVPPPSASKVDPLPTMQPTTVSPTGTARRIEHRRGRHHRCRDKQFRRPAVDAADCAIRSRRSQPTRAADWKVATTRQVACRDANNLRAYGHACGRFPGAPRGESCRRTARGSIPVGSLHDQNTRQPRATVRRRANRGRITARRDRNPDGGATGRPRHRRWRTGVAIGISCLANCNRCWAVRGADRYANPGRRRSGTGRHAGRAETPFTGCADGTHSGVDGPYVRWHAAGDNASGPA